MERSGASEKKGALTSDREGFFPWLIRGGAGGDRTTDPRALRPYNRGVLTLLVLQGPDKGQRFELPEELITLGRESRQVPLSDNTVSRRHCEISPRDGLYVLTDLGSANGTYLNGLRVQAPQPVRIGDQLRVGRSLMVFGSVPTRGAGTSSTGGSSQGSGGGDLIELAGEEAGVDSAIMHTVGANDDSLILAVPDPSAAAVSNLQILYKLSAALGSAFDVQQAMAITMDLVFEHVKAERGLVLLKPTADASAHGGGGAGKDSTTSADLEPIVLRRRGDALPADPAAAPAPIRASRTIINHVMASGEGVLSSNAMADRRFSKGRSVHDLGIRSALCVPIKARRISPSAASPSPSEILGVLYIDSSVRNYTYSPDQLRLLSAIGLQAGMAVQNAKLYQAALRAERLAAIGETTAALSHSIKNILQALRGGADVVDMGFSNANLSQASKGWQIVDRNLNRILGLTTNLLAYSRPRTPELRAVSLPKLLRECVETLAPAANERGVMVIPEVDEDQPPVPIDEDGLHQVVMNLLSNALDAVEAKTGLIKISSRYDEATDHAIIEVLDNGPGIPPTMRQHLFELFHSTKGNRGTGMGLAVSKKIVEEHEGTITAESPAPQPPASSAPLPADGATIASPPGTLFRIRLPMRRTTHPSDSWTTPT